MGWLQRLNGCVGDSGSVRKEHVASGALNRLPFSPDPSLGAGFFFESMSFHCGKIGVDSLDFKGGYQARTEQTGDDSDTMKQDVLICN